MITVCAEPTPPDASLLGFIKDLSACRMAYMILGNPNTSRKTDPRSDLSKLTHNSNAIRIPNIHLVAIEDDIPATSGGILITFC